MTAITTTRPVRAAAVVPIVRRKKLLHLQALRGLAASLVVLSHCADTLGRYHSFPTRYAARLAISGYFGVATFFIISGFIIYKTSAGSFGQPAAITVFVLKRLIRIFPIYWVATAVFVVLSPHRADYSVSDIVFSSLLIPHALPSADNLHPLIGQGWTLHYELLFYLIFAIGLFFGSPHRHTPDRDNACRSGRGG